MASQGGTRYEDRTMGRGGSGHNNTGHHNYSVSENKQIVENSTFFYFFETFPDVLTCRLTVSRWRTCPSTTLSRALGVAGCTLQDNTW